MFWSDLTNCIWIIRRPPRSTLLPYTTLVYSGGQHFLDLQSTFFYRAYQNHLERVCFAKKNLKSTLQNAQVHKAGQISDFTFVLFVWRA